MASGQSGSEAKQRARIFNLPYDAYSDVEKEEIVAEPTSPDLESSPRRACQKLLESLGMQAPETDHHTHDKDVKGLSDATFTEHQWDQALLYLDTHELLKDDDDARHWLWRGGKYLGLWPMSDASLQGLMSVLFQRRKCLSPGMERYRTHLTHEDKSNLLENRLIIKDFFTEKRLKELALESNVSSKSVVVNGMMEIMDKVNNMRNEGKHCWSVWCSESSIKLIFFLLFVLICNAYALEVILVMYPSAVQTLGWPIYFARACGFGISVLTSLMFFSMSKSILKIAALCMNGTVLLEGHMELHAFFGELMVVWSVIHTIGHAVATVPGVMSLPEDDINALLGCAHNTTHKGYLGVSMPAIMWPDCPMKKPRGWHFLDYLFRTVPGLTGVLLWILLAATAWTAKARRRKKHYDLFYYVHNFVVFAWPVLLFFHGSQGWIGVGFPLVVFTTSFPFLFYLFDRISRLVRACQQATIVNCIVRPGPHGGPKGALTFLQLKRPMFWWGYQAGSYGHLCMPGYALLQWHPFTICSGRNSDTVDFIVASVGDWTEELARRCLDADGEKSEGLPRILVDGPHHAPMTNALGEEFLVAVGAGVGVTPLLSLMASVVSMIDDDWNKVSGTHRKVLKLKEVHFYWMTRSADEFLLARKQITEIVSKKHVRNMVFLHLHVTATPPPKDALAYLFREAVRRQSQRDREAFQTILNEAKSATDIIHGPNTPWAWVNGSKLDLIWSNELIYHENNKVPDAKNIGPKVPFWAQKSLNASHSQIIAESAEQDGLHRQGSFASMRKLLQLKSGNIPKRESCNLVLDDTHMLPIFLGRPDFAVELASIGLARADADIGVYVCGNELVVKSLKEACSICQEVARKMSRRPPGMRTQKYSMHWERFG